MMNAIPESGATFGSSRFSASSPPADAPMPTIGHQFSGKSGTADCSGTSSSGEGIASGRSDHGTRRLLLIYAIGCERALRVILAVSKGHCKPPPPADDLARCQDPRYPDPEGA